MKNAKPRTFPRRQDSEAGLRTRQVQCTFRVTSEAIADKSKLRSQRESGYTVRSDM